MKKLGHRLALLWSLLSMVGMGAALTTSTADAGYVLKVGGHHQQKVQSLRKAREIILKAIGLGETYSFRPAVYELRLAKIEVSGLPYSSDKSKLLEALNVAIEKLSDYGLSSHQKALILSDCGDVALGAISDLMDQYDYGGGQSYGLNYAIQLMNNVQVLVAQHKLTQALSKLSQAENILDDYAWDSDIQRALDSADLLREKLLDPYLQYWEKVTIARDCVASVNQSIRQSNAYARNPHGTNIEVFLGESGKLEKLGVDSETVYVGRNRGKFRHLVLTAQKNVAYLKEIQIVFGNGQRIYRFEKFLSQHGRLRIDLGSLRFVDRVILKGTTNNLFGSRARIRVSGVK